MKRCLKNLLVSIGSSYHPSVRLLHAMARDKSDSKILLFNLAKASFVNNDLREDYSIRNYEFKKTFDLFKGWLTKEQFELIGISFMSHHWDIYVEITKMIRETLPNCKIVSGGVHAWRINPLETLKHCDYVCAAEGEEVYSTLVDSFTGSGSPYPLRIPGIIEKYNGGVIETPANEYMPIDRLPIPTIGSKQIYYLSSAGDRPVFLNEDPQIKDPFGYVHIGRGCPFKCTFCINSLAEKRELRIRSVERVVEELKALRNVKQIKAVIFMDEVFPLRQKWLEEFARRYREDIGLPFVITLYPGMLTYENAKLLKYAGLKEVSIGIQSGSERVRADIYNRPGANDKIIEENAVLSRLNIMTYYDFIIKNPFESEKDYRMSLELIRNLKRPFYLKFHTLAFYPKHPISKMALDNRLIDPKEVDATIGYHGVTTPHKVAVVKHYLLENQLVLWHGRMLKDMIRGSVEASYYLLMSYYGFSFIPKFVLEFLHSRFIKKQIKVLYIFAFFIHGILVVRNNPLIKKLYLIITVCQEKGILYLIKSANMKFRLALNACIKKRESHEVV